MRTSSAGKVELGAFRCYPQVSVMATRIAILHSVQRLQFIHTSPMYPPLCATVVIHAHISAVSSILCNSCNSRVSLYPLLCSSCNSYHISPLYAPLCAKLSFTLCNSYNLRVHPHSLCENWKHRGVKRSRVAWYEACEQYREQYNQLLAKKPRQCTNQSELTFKPSSRMIASVHSSHPSLCLFAP